MHFRHRQTDRRSAKNITTAYIDQPLSAMVASFVARSCSALSRVSTGMDDRLLAGIPPWYVTKPTRSTQPCITLGSLNRVLALIGPGKSGNVNLPGGRYNTV